MNNLIPIKFKNQNVITTELLAEVYGTDTKNISKNFSRNIGKFEESKHYYLLEGEVLKEFKGNRLLDDNLKFAPKLYLWTERGANRHCKILDTDKAWEQFDNLEETYFKVKDNIQQQLPTNYIEALENLVESEKEKEQLKLENREQEQKLLEVQPKAEKWSTFLNSEGLTTIDDFSKAIAIKDLGRNNMYNYLRSKGLLRQDNSPYQAYIEQGLMIKRQSGCYLYRGSLESSYKTYLTNKGIDKIITMLNKDGYIQIN
ncbi:phage antirepressor KilAC domain-containing protein [Clostridioides mangenotii]|uniref:ORF6N domain-containing protein n=1 Tax=Metaclostridioides mangenotii TaxID=1540 RepID=UPI002149D6CF|nr:ORF6N domain-containing protein [Clostridioides mangenotii]MCR1953832.1 phage antirepressor KilAC domain-containing protein [Clostridioides mangenotii]